MIPFEDAPSAKNRLVIEVKKPNVKVKRDSETVSQHHE